MRGERRMVVDGLAQDQRRPQWLSYTFKKFPQNLQAVLRRRLANSFWPPPLGHALVRKNSS
jgi:hypothetical protein